MTSSSSPGRHLLLDLPPLIVSQILDLHADYECIYRLWSTGSNALHTMLGRAVTIARVTVSRKREISAKSNFLSSLRSLLHLEIMRRSDDPTDGWEMLKAASLLRSVSPTLETLNLDDWPHSNRIFCPPKPDTASFGHSRDDSDDEEPEGNGNGWTEVGRGRGGRVGRGNRGGRDAGDQGARGGGRGGRGSERGGRGGNRGGGDGGGRGGGGGERGRGEMRGMRGRGGRGGTYVAKIFRPDFEPIDFGRQLPALKTLSMRSNKFSCAALSSLPSSLTHLTVDFVTDTEAWASALPRQLLVLECRASQEGLSFPPDFLKALPPSITHLDTPIPSGCWTYARECMPSSITRLGQDVDHPLDIVLTSNLPPLLEHLRLNGAPTLSKEPIESAIMQLPKTLTHFECTERAFTFTPSLLRLLPRGITQLACYADIKDLLSGDLPNDLKRWDLEVFVEGKTKPNWTAIPEPSLASPLDGSFALALPRTLQVLKVPFSCLSEDGKFFSGLPQGLLEFSGQNSNTDPSELVFPPHLTSLKLGRDVLPIPRERGESFIYPGDMDGPVAKKISPQKKDKTEHPIPDYSHLPIKKPFPLHLLPRSLTFLLYNHRPMPISALSSLPNLANLYVLDMVEDALFDAKNPQLVSLANKRRTEALEAAKTKAILNRLDTQSLDLQLASPLTHVGAFDLIPRSIRALWVLIPRDLLDHNEDDWRLHYPGAYRITLGTRSVLKTSQVRSSQGNLVPRFPQKK